jgi:hypothetical protein
MGKARCERCGQILGENFEADGVRGVGGRCEICGEKLCAECADWRPDMVKGVCKECRGTGKYGSFEDAVVCKLYHAGGISEENHRKFYYKGREAVRKDICALIWVARNEMSKRICDLFYMAERSLERFKDNTRTHEERKDYVEGFNEFLAEYRKRLCDLETVIDCVIDEALVNVGGKYFADKFIKDRGIKRNKEDGKYETGKSDF